MPAGRFVKRQIVIIILINLEKPFIPPNSFFFFIRRKTFKRLNRDVDKVAFLVDCCILATWWGAGSMQREETVKGRP